jgi:hypothetical protein
MMPAGPRTLFLRLSPAPRAETFWNCDPGICSLRSLHPRPGSPAEQLGWGGSLYAVVRSAPFFHRVNCS